MSPHPFTLDRRAEGPVPVCRCTLAMGAALHHPSRVATLTERVESPTAGQ